MSRRSDRSKGSEINLVVNSLHCCVVPRRHFSVHVCVHQSANCLMRREQILMARVLRIRCYRLERRTQHRTSTPLRRGGLREFRSTLFMRLAAIGNCQLVDCLWRLLRQGQQCHQYHGGHRHLGVGCRDRPESTRLPSLLRHLRWNIPPIPWPGTTRRKWHDHLSGHRAEHRGHVLLCSHRLRFAGRRKCLLERSAQSHSLTEYTIKALQDHRPPQFLLPPRRTGSGPQEIDLLRVFFFRRLRRVAKAAPGPVISALPQGGFADGRRNDRIRAPGGQAVSAFS